MAADVLDADDCLFVAVSLDGDVSVELGAFTPRTAAQWPRQIAAQLVAEADKAEAGA